MIPNASKLAIKLIKNYLYFYNKKIEHKLRKKVLYNRFRKLSTNKIFISKGEFKHTNNKVYITIFIYNRQKNNLLLKLKKRYLFKIFNKIISFKKNKLDFFSRKKRLVNKLILLKKINKINTEGLKSMLDFYTFRFDIINLLKNLNKNKEITKFKAISKYLNKFYKKLVRKSLRKLLTYVYYRQLIFINKSKFNYIYLQQLSSKLQDIFNKNIEFNFINLKHFYLDSNILSESILLKITKNRRRLKRQLKKLEKKIRIKNRRIVIGKIIKKENLNIKRYFHNKYLLNRYIINNLKYKHIAGFRLEAKGRLNRRYTASRSMYKVKYNGSLLNIDSSYKTLSSVLLKGNLSPNLQYTKLNSKSRIGSFGIKG